MKRILSLFALVLLAASSSPADQTKATDLKAGDVLPNLQAVTLNGTKFDLAADTKGKVVLIDFWATWCGPCVAEIPGIKASYEKWHDKGFEVVGISFDDSPAKARAFAEKSGMNWITICDGQASKSAYPAMLGITAIPQQILLGRDGRVFANNLRGRELAAAIDTAMAGAGTAAAAKTTAVILPPVWAAVDAALATGTPAASAAALENALATGKPDPIILRLLAGRHGLNPAGSPHAATLYQIADIAVRGFTTDHNAYVQAAAARAHAAIDLGGPYLVDLLVDQLERIQARDATELDDLFVHLAAKTGNPARYAQRATEQLVRRKTDATRVVAQLGILAAAGVPSTHPALREITAWLDRQQGLPADRLQLKPDNTAIIASYNPRGTPLAGGMRFSCIVSQANGNLTVLPMEITAGNTYSATIPADLAAAGTLLWIRDESGTTDTNGGKPWTITK